MKLKIVCVKVQWAKTQWIQDGWVEKSPTTISKEATKTETSST